MNQNNTIPSKVRGGPVVGSLSMVLMTVLVLLMTGCSATSLRCGVDTDSSFVELYNVPQNFSQNIRSYSELCGFAYEGPAEPDVKLNLISPE